MKFISHNPQETQQIAKKLAQKYRQGKVLALIGPLGAGKTTFTQGFAQGLKIQNRLISPTFVLMRQYQLPQNPQGKLFHIDLYRLDNISQIDDLGLSEIFANPKNIVLIEWAEKLKKLPENTVTISFKTLSANSREIEIEEV